MEFGEGGTSGKANWAFWSQMPNVELWQAVALSIDRSPGEWGYGCRTRGSFSESFAQRDFGTGFWDRMRIAQASLSSSGPLRALHLSSDIRYNPRTEVSLPEFGTWAESKGWKLPAEFPRVSPPAESAPPPADGNDKPLGSNERNTLLVIIAALCDYSNIDVNARGAATQIARLTDEFGASITDDTVRKHLGSIPSALESRKK